VKQIAQVAAISMANPALGSAVTRRFELLTYQLH